MVIDTALSGYPLAATKAVAIAVNWIAPQPLSQDFDLPTCTHPTEWNSIDIRA
jgi:hypothetical protein